MRRVLLIGLALTLALGGGCKARRAAKTSTTPTAGPPAAAPVAPPGGEGLSAHAPTGVVINPGTGGGGSGGAAQAVRKAVTRTVTQNEMKNIHTFIDAASLSSGQMPSVQETAAALQKEAPATSKLVQDRAIILTGTKSREGIWAYTADPQFGDQHLVVTASGIDRMDAQTLRQRLGQ